MNTIFHRSVPLLSRSSRCLRLTLVLFARSFVGSLVIADIGLADQPELVDSVVEANTLQYSIAFNAMQQSLSTEQTVN